MAGLDMSLWDKTRLRDREGLTVEVSDSFIQLGEEAIDSILRRRDSFHKNIFVFRLLQKDL